MGQQQLILILLVTILVGVATMLAINTMEESQLNANHDAVRQVMLDASAEAQGFYNKSRMFGGGGRSYEGITLNHIGIQEDNLHGDFSISDQNQNSFTLTAIPAAGGENIVGVIYRDRIEFVDSEE